MTRQIKVFFEPEAHDRVRLAAALQRRPMAAFCREVVLREASRLTEGLPLDADGKVTTNPTHHTPNKRRKNP
jgi:hypothetical protein